MARGTPPRSAGKAFALLRPRYTPIRLFPSRSGHNIASRRVMERLDMVHVGEITARGLVDGQIGEADDAPFAVYMKQVAVSLDP